MGSRKLSKKIYKEIVLTKDKEININWLGKGNDEYINNLIFTHKKANIKSRINIKAVLLDESIFNLEALVKINKKAKNIDTYLSIKVLVLSDKAFARAVPSLEILENEVKAGHSATITYIDKNEIYYLESRGLDKESAEKLIIDSFLK